MRERSTKRLLSRFKTKFLSPVETAKAPAGVELVLRLDDGEPWVLTLSSGMETFIGRYPRLAGIGPEDTLLAFSALRQS
jgi:hypothetical protein